MMITAMNLMITGLGMITSVGFDAASSCASIRAGLNRRREIDYYTTLETETMDAIPIIGCPVSGYADGFNKVGRWIRLGLGCLQDLIDQNALPDSSDAQFWLKTGLIGVTPPCQEPRIDADEACTPTDVQHAFLHPLLDQLDRPIPKSNLEMVCGGHSGAVMAVDRAPDMMARKGLERVIVLGVDSYLDPESLDWLAENHRLKIESVPTGLMPGEAGACFLLESGRAAQNRRAKGLAVVVQPALGTEENHYYSDGSSQGAALAGVIHQAIVNAGLDGPFAGEVISDMNGETWRAYELGSARIRLSSVLSGEAGFIFPADSLGEVGAASGAVAICMAARMLHRRYSLGDTVLIASSSDAGPVGALCVRNAIATS